MRPGLVLWAPSKAVSRARYTGGVACAADGMGHYCVEVQWRYSSAAELKLYL